MLSIEDFLNESIARGRRSVHQMETVVDGYTYHIDGSCHLYELEEFLELNGYIKIKGGSEADLYKKKELYYKTMKTKLGIRVSIKNGEKMDAEMHGGYFQQRR